MELNWPWAKRENFWLVGSATGVGAGQAVPVGGCFEQIRNTTKVTGVEVGTGVVVVLLLPQLNSNAAIMKPRTGTITRHLFRHIEHQAMALRLQSCQEVRAKEYLALPFS